MILNHKGAIEFLIDPLDEIGFNRFTITNLHALLSENLLGNPSAEGRLRTIPVDIGRSVYVPKRFYIEGLPGVYEINDPALFKDVFMWAYRRSASRYKVIQESLGVPDPKNLQYRQLIKNSVRELVEAGTKKEAAAEGISQLLRTEVESGERNDVAIAIERELISLHEGNIARFKLDLRTFQKWKTEWDHSFDKRSKSKVPQ